MSSYRHRSREGEWGPSWSGRVPVQTHRRSRQGVEGDQGGDGGDGGGGDAHESQKRCTLNILWHRTARL